MALRNRTFRSRAGAPPPRVSALPVVAAALAGLAAAVLAAAGAAAAQDRPPLTPARDVAVTYRMTGAGQKEIRIAWLAAEGRLRLDLPAELGGSMIVDRHSQRAFMVMEQQRLVVELPLGGDIPRLGELPPGARLTRLGEDRVAGHPCMVWRYEERGQAGRACITADGVMLRAVGAGAAPGPAGDGDGLEATVVAYGPQDPARFRPPAEYRAMRAPAPGATRTAAGR